MDRGQSTQAQSQQHRIETYLEPVFDDVEEQMRRQRMLLKEKIAAYLSKKLRQKKKRDGL